MIVLGYLLVYLYLASLLLIAYALNKYFKVRLIITRKFVHIMVAFVWLINYYFFGTTIHIIIPPITFIILNYLSYRKNLFQGIEDGNSLGTVYYPISVLIMAIITYFVPEFYLAYGIGIFCMGLGDGFAPLVAGYLKSRQIINNKTLTGTATVFIMAVLIAVIFNSYFQMGYQLFKLIIIGVAAAGLELLGIKGLDNLYVPLGVSIIVFFLGVI